jgi:O-acetyl-ADP-ribose deacetylase (regulator of RNase III)
MSIEICSGDLLAADVEALVNPVNCVGVMGKGLALVFKKRFPDAFRAYAKACAAHEVVPGRMFVVSTKGRTILHFPTKRHFRDASRMEDIEAGLVSLAAEISAREIRSIAIPAIGCGLGGLSWDDVRPRIERALTPVAGVRVMLFAPG